MGAGVGVAVRVGVRVGVDVGVGVAQLGTLHCAVQPQGPEAAGESRHPPRQLLDMHVPPIAAQAALPETYWA